MAIREVRRKDGTRHYEITFFYWVDPATVPDGKPPSIGEPVPYKAESKRIVKKREGGFGTRTEAQTELGRRKAEARAGTYRDPEREKQRAVDRRGDTFAEFTKTFLRDYRGRGGKPRSEYYAHAAALFLERFKDRYLREITRADVEAFARERAAKVGPSTLRKNLTALGTMFHAAMEWELVATNPVALVRKPGEPEHRLAYLTEADLGRLLDAASPWLRPLLRFAVAQGLRLKEVTGLRWEDVDRKGGRIYVNPDNKTGRPDPIRLTAQGAAVLDEADDRRREVGRKTGKVVPWVFVTEAGEDYHGPLTRKRITMQTIQTMQAIGKPGCSFHTLRHTTASWLVQRGVDLGRVREFMRHRNIQTTLRYAHLRPEHLDDAVDALDSAMDARVDTRATEVSK